MKPDKATLEKSEKIIERIKNGSKFLIIPDGSRVDYDCLGTSIALKKSLEQLGFEARIYIFNKIPEYLSSFEVVKDQVTTKYLNEVDFDFYDLVFLIDTNDWDRVLTRNFEKVLSNYDQDKFINIDHHILGTINEGIPNNVLNTGDICAGKVLYDTIIKPLEINLDGDISNALYLSLVGDSSIFKFISDDTFEYADLLIKNGADHSKICDFILTFKKAAFDFFSVAVEKTDYYPELKLTILNVTEELHKELSELFGGNWVQDDYAEFYKEYFQRRIEGYDYGIIFRWEEATKGSRISFRTKNSGQTLEIIPILNEIGFKGGGHRNAGGGFAPSEPIKASQKFLEEFKKKFTEDL